MQTSPTSSNNIITHLISFFRHPRARAVSLLFIIHGLMMSTWIAQVPFFKTNLGLNDAELGKILLGIPLGVIIMNTMAGWVLDRIGAWRSIVIAYLLYAIAMTVLLTAASPWILFLNLLFAGLVSSIVIVGGNTLASRIERSENIYVMSTCHGTFSLGAMTGALISSYAIAINFPAIYQMIAITILFAVFIFSHKKHFLDIPSNMEESQGATFGFPNRALWFLIFIGLTCAFAEGMIVDWSAVYLRDVCGAPPEMAALGYGACALTMMLVRLSGDMLAPKYGNRKIIIFGGIMTALGIAINILFPFPLVSIFGFGLVGIGIALGIPLLMGLASRTEGFSDGAGVGIFATFAFLGFIIEPPLVGWVAELTHLKWGLAVVAIIALVGSGLATQMKG